MSKSKSKQKLDIGHSIK